MWFSFVKEIYKLLGGDTLKLRSFNICSQNWWSFIICGRKHLVQIITVHIAETEDRALYEG